MSTQKMLPDLPKRKGSAQPADKNSRSREGRLVIRYGGRHGRVVTLVPSTDHVVIRSSSRLPILEPRRAFQMTPISLEARALLERYQLEFRLPIVGVEVVRPRGRVRSAERDAMIRVLNDEPQIDFAGRVLVDPVSKRPVIYTENIFVKFGDEEPTNNCLRILEQYALRVLRSLPYARNAFFVNADRKGLAVFQITENLLNEPAVELCHPELIRESRQRHFFPQQWHLGKTTTGGNVVDAHASVIDAWELTRGRGAVIAIIDDGVDIDHEEFQPAVEKIVAPRDVTRNSDDPRPGNSDHHGTACAGVACASGTVGAAGVAPEAKLMPIRLAAVLHSQPEADAFVWAADHGADVISCSWGPKDGDWTKPDDPLHVTPVALPDSTRLAIEYAATQGRNGKGCVIVFAAGNGNESVDYDGYASCENVIAVAACNDTGKRSYYSDYGKAIWCSFPSDDVADASPITTGIWTTDRSGAPGYNPGDPARGDEKGNYTNWFGGTSSAAPGVAGVAALMLSVNDSLTANEVRDLLRHSCDRIDEAGGEYDAVGRSAFYGFGRVNAAQAVKLASDARSQGPIVVHRPLKLRSNAASKTGR